MSCCAANEKGVGSTFDTAKSKQQSRAAYWIRPPRNRSSVLFTSIVERMTSARKGATACWTEVRVSIVASPLPSHDNVSVRVLIE